MRNADFKMPFGKYREVELEEIWEDDKDYLYWCLENLSSEDICQAIEEFIEDADERDKRWRRK